MNHEEIRELLHAYADGELDPINARTVEQHLTTCAECRRTQEQIRALREAMTTPTSGYRAPARLRRNIRAALRREAKETRLSPWLVFATGAALAAVLLGLILFPTLRGSRENMIVDQVVANHIRSLLATHLVDVASSDQHTVKPWFDGKIDFAPDVPDLATNGFPLAGGRLDYLDGKTVVALVYQRNKHPINVFILPATRTTDTEPRSLKNRGYNVLSWTHREMQYWAISDLNEAELRHFADLLTR